MPIFDGPMRRLVGEQENVGTSITEIADRRNDDARCDDYVDRTVTGRYSRGPALSQLSRRYLAYNYGAATANAEPVAVDETPETLRDRLLRELNAITRMHEEMVSQGITEISVDTNPCREVYTDDLYRRSDFWMQPTRLRETRADTIVTDEVCLKPSDTGEKAKEEKPVERYVDKFAKHHEAKGFDRYDWRNTPHGMMDRFASMVAQHINAKDSSYYTAGYELTCRTGSFDAMPCPKTKGNISLFLSREDRDRDRRTSGRAGKMIRKVFPDLPDDLVEKMVETFRDEFVFDTEAYTLKVSEAAEDFKWAYSHSQADYQTPRTTDWRKSLACSCMRYGFNSLPMHPCEVYASGDFLIVWAEEVATGKIAGRSVVRKDPAKFGPIYGTSEGVLDMIEGHLKEQLNATPAGHGDWEGARLIAEPYNSGYIGPYLDVVPANLTVDGDYLVIDRDGEIHADDYQGVLGGAPHNCCECDAEVDDDDVCMSEDGGDAYCRDCYHERYTNCDRTGDEVDRDDAISVWDTDWRGRLMEQTWCERAVDMYATECVDGEYYEDSLVYEAVNGDSVTDRHIERGDYFCSAQSGCIYPIEDGVYLNGELVGGSEVDPDLHTFNDSTNEWETKDAA